MTKLRQKGIRGYAGYNIDREGNIFSYKKYNNGAPKKSYPDKKGYLRTTMTKSKGVYRTEYVHRLVWSTIKRKDIPSGMEINHIDGNKANNCIDNLELVTHKENMIHAHKTGLANTNHLKDRNLKIKREWYPMIKCLSINMYSQSDIAEMIGTTQENVSKILKTYTQ